MNLVGIDFDNCIYIFTQSNETLGTNIESYSTGSKITSAKTQIEQALGPAENWYLHVLATDKAGNKVESISQNSVEIENTAEFDYTGNVQTADLLAGKYKFECWGASGGNSENTVSPGKGSYASGILNINNNKLLYVYVGSGEFSRNNYLFNGGGPGESSGGSATDIRVTSGNWDNFESLKSRIIVAGGGGGGFYINNTSNHEPGNAGGLNGYTADAYYSNYSLSERGYSGCGATQTTKGFSEIINTDSSFLNAGYHVVDAGFGYGGYGINNEGQTYSSGGGAGYYGGGHGVHPGSTWSGGGGGSSFISGHDGCNAIAEESTQDNIIHTNQSIHYSRLYFTETIMIDGAGYKWTNTKENQQQMPNPAGGYYALGEGHSGNGYARITNLN